MAGEYINSLFLQSDTEQGRPELLVSSVLHLMSHYIANSRETEACTKLASVIERHLKALADLPTIAPVLCATCLQLSEQWADIVERAIAKPEKTSFLTRLMQGK